MNVDLTPDLEQLIQSKVESGRYSSPSEVVREALQQMNERDESRARRLQDIRDRVDKALAEAARGEGVDGETFVQQLRDKLEKRKAG